MKKAQYNQNADNQSSTTLLSMLLHRLELMGLFMSFVVRTSLRRCSSMVRSISLLSLLFFIAIFCSASFSTNNTFAAASLTVEVAGSVNLDILPKSSAGTFAHSSTSDNTVSVSTDNYTGYTLGIAASSDNSGNNTLSYIKDNTTIDTINTHSIVAGVSDTNYANDTYASYNNLNNTWGYRPSTYYDTTNNTAIDNTSTNLYFPAPSSTSATILAKTTTANATETTDHYNIAIGARVGLDKTPGAYSNTLVITVIANAVPYTVTYNANAGSDTVSNMPTNITNGLTYTDTIILDDTTNPTIPERDGYTFGGWCTSGTSETTCASDGTGSSTDGTLYNTTNNNLASFPINSTTTNNINVYAIWAPSTRTCTKQYRLQNADGTFPDAYTTDTTEELSPGDTCTYTKSVTDYKNAADGTNDAEATTSGTVTSDGLTLSLDFYRNTYTLTVSKGSNITAASATTAAVHGSNYYRWGQGVALSATKSSNTTCANYNTPSWSQSGTAGAFSTTSSATPTFTMGKGAVTVTATSSASNKSQTITLSRGTGATGINIGGTNRTGSSVSLNCGSYSISGNYSSGYEFSSWSKSGSISVSSTSSASTTLTVSGSGTLTLNTRSCSTTAFSGNMQNFSTTTISNACNGTTGSLTDTRTSTSYLVAKINGKLFMEQNLYLPTGKELTSSDTNITSSSWTTPTASLTAGGSYTEARMVAGTHPNNTYNATGGWYNYCAASAGTVCNNKTAQNANEDICPAGWRLPTSGEMGDVASAKRSNWKFYAGYYYNGSLESASSFSSWWSATASNASRQYYLIYNIGSLYTNSYGSKSSGHFVRCVRK